MPFGGTPSPDPILIWIALAILALGGALAFAGLVEMILGAIRYVKGKRNV